jgi:hypothetical protein
MAKTRQDRKKLARIERLNNILKNNKFIKSLEKYRYVERSVEETAYIIAGYERDRLASVKAQFEDLCNGVNK